MLNKKKDKQKLPKLTLVQTENVRLYQTERVSGRQFQI